METMDEAYRRDYRDKRLLDEAQQAVDAVLANASRIGGTKLRDELLFIRERLADVSASIVRAWD